jgi:nickel/cobalt exporter
MPAFDFIVTPFMIGLSHSMETDHVMAVGNLVNVRSAWHEEALRGITWGLGHTASVVLAAFAISFMKLHFPDSGVFSFEVLVGAMMVLIGTIKLYRMLFISRQETHPHKAVFFHIGILHGLAGSGAIAALASGKLVSTNQQITFLLLFGLGTILGMGLITATITRLRFLKLQYLSLCSGLLAFFSLIYGIKILCEQMV